MKWIKEYEAYKEEDNYHIFYNMVSEKIKKYSEQFNKIFNVFGINSSRINLKSDKHRDRMSIFINFTIMSEKVSKNLYPGEKGCIVPVFLYKDVDIVKFVKKYSNDSDAVVNIVFFRDQDDYLQFDKHCNKNGHPSVFYECIYKDDDRSSMICIVKTLQFYLLNLSNKLSFSNLIQSLEERIIEKFPLSNILIRYCNVLVEKDLFSIDGPLDELYEIMYDELRNFHGIHELMFKIKEKQPDLYHKLMIKGEDDMKKSSDLGQMGF
jgi:hypothetical protein